MRIPYRYVAPWMGYWSFVSERSMNRWHCMADEVEHRCYGPEKLLSDTLQFWSDIGIGWVAACRSTRSEVARVFFLIPKGNRCKCDCKEIDLFAPACPIGKPEVAYVRRIVGSGKEQIGEKNVRVYLSPRRHALVIHLDDLPKDLRPSVYEGLVHIADEVVAQVIIKVADESVADSGLIRRPDPGEGAAPDECAPPSAECRRDGGEGGSDPE